MTHPMTLALATLLLSSCSFTAVPTPTAVTLESAAAATPTIISTFATTVLPTHTLTAVLTSTTTPTTAASPTASPAALFYTVQAGDTLSGIAARFGVPLEVLATANSVADSNTISVGMVLQVPVAAADGTTAPDPVVDAAPTQTPTAAEIDTAKGFYDTSLSGCLAVPTSWQPAKVLGKSVSFTFVKPDGRVWIDYEGDVNLTSQDDADVLANQAVLGLGLIFASGGHALKPTDYRSVLLQFPGGKGYEYFVTVQMDDMPVDYEIYVCLVPAPQGGTLVGMAVGYDPGPFPQPSRDAILQVLASYKPGSSC